jgi:uncharacterized protein
MSGAATRRPLTLAARNPAPRPLPGLDQVREVHRHAAPWPYRGLDLAQLRSEGWRPTPVRELVVKVHQRCNLACDYCYVYTQADQSWRDRPAVMSDDVWQATIGALARHVRKHELMNARVVLHGGEPLLLGPAKLGEMVTQLRAQMPAFCALEVGMQTNGVLLKPATVAALRRHGITVGVSVDGTETDHDKHRVTHGGRGTFARVRAALDLLRRPENRASYAGILCTVSPDTDPIACYEQLLEFEPPVIDFLLPHANWQNSPWGWSATEPHYAHWLIAIFDRWYPGSTVRIRLFEELISLLIGGGSRSEYVGLSPMGMLVVESDGAIEQIDALKSAYPGACATGLDIRSHDLDDALDDPGVVARQIGRRALSVQCSHCPVSSVCGGGHYAHRYDPASGFLNPSVYCRDMITLIEHIRTRVSTDIQQRLAEGRDDGDA